MLVFKKANSCLSVNSFGFEGSSAHIALEAENLGICIERRPEVFRKQLASDMAYTTYLVNDVQTVL